MSKTTICELITQLKSYKDIKDNKNILTQLDAIQQKAEKMEDRLLQYCNAIEDLGFIRVGRDYNNQ